MSNILPPTSWALVGLLTLPAAASSTVAHTRAYATLNSLPMLDHVQNLGIRDRRARSRSEQ